MGQIEDLAFEDEMITLRLIEREYNEFELPKVQANIQGFLDEFPADEKRAIRLKLLVERMKDAKKNKDITNLKKYVQEYQILKGLVVGIEPGDIIRAREYPITNFVKTRVGMASCMFHEDKTPSMNVKNNFYYCHSCGETGDVIDMAMKKLGITFKEAVRYLVQ